MSAQRKIKLAPGYTIDVYEKSVVVGGRNVFFNRPVEERDVLALKAIFQLGRRVEKERIANAIKNFKDQLDLGVF